ncbi:MAG: hypothetical protein H0X29_11245 [Parachlamydiaceae bacterium]|nr:hypothetical protein [Parachlamydiaceae bacterium]
MSSSYIKEFVSGTLHTSFNYLIPSNTLIGAISGGVGFYTRALVITYPGIFSWGVNGYYVGICSWGFSFAPTFLENHFDLKNRAIDIGNAIGF